MCIFSQAWPPAPRDRPGPSRGGGTLGAPNTDAVASSLLPSHHCILFTWTYVQILPGVRQWAILAGGAAAEGSPPSPPVCPSCVFI